MALDPASAFGWIGQVAEYVGSWIPRPMQIWHTEQAVVFSTWTWFCVHEKWWWESFKIFRCKRPPYLIENGHNFWYMPVWWDVEKYAAVDKSINIGEFPVLTRSGDNCTVDCVARYKIIDPMALALGTEEPDEIIGTIVTEQCRQVVLSYESVDDLVEATAEMEIDESLLCAVNEIANEYGVEFRSASLILGKSFVLHLTGSSYGSRGGDEQ